MRPLLRVICTTALCFVLTWFSPAAHASTIAVLPGAGGSETAAWNDDVTIGWSFDLTTPFLVTALGFFDGGGNGLVDSHEVGLWNGGGALLTSTFVPAGTGATLDQGFRWVDIAPILLPVGSYTIGAFGLVTSPDTFRSSVPTVVTVDGLTFGQDHLFEPGASLTKPTFDGGFSGFGYFGPNLQVQSVPEPATLLLLGCGLAGVVARRRMNART